MDDGIPGYRVYSPLSEYVIEQGKTEPVTLREHLEVLQTYIDGRYEHHAQSTLESLDPEELDMVPEEAEEEHPPACVVYYLPNRQLLRVLPEINFELQEWDFTDEDEEEAEAADVLHLFGDMEHDSEMIAALLEVARVCKRIGDRRVQEERLRFMAGGKDDA